MEKGLLLNFTQLFDRLSSGEGTKKQIKLENVKWELARHEAIEKFISDLNTDFQTGNLPVKAEYLSDRGVRIVNSVINPKVGNKDLVKIFIVMTEVPTALDINKNTGFVFSSINDGTLNTCTSAMEFVDTDYFKDNLVSLIQLLMEQ